MSDRPVRVYRLDVTYPPEPDRDAVEAWYADNWSADPDAPPWRWPTLRRYLSRTGAEGRAEMLRRYGATVTVIASDPVTWPDSREEIR